MPIWGYDKDDQLIATWDAGYPAPASMLEHLKMNPGSVVRFEDIPPMTPEFYRVEPGAGAAVPKPALEVKLSKLTVEADEADAISTSDIPAGATVSVAGPATSGNFVADGDPLHFLFQEPGEHTIAVHAPGFRPLSVKIEATPASSTKMKRGRKRRKPKEGTEVQIGLSGDTALEHAEADIDIHFDGIESRHARFLPMQAEAKAWLNGDGSERIEALAEAQGTEPKMVAESIMNAVESYWKTQQDRIAAKRELRELVAEGARRTELVERMRERGYPVGAAHRQLNADIAVRPTSERT